MVILDNKMLMEDADVDAKIMSQFSFNMDIHFEQKFEEFLKKRYGIDLKAFDTLIKNAIPEELI